MIDPVLAEIPEDVRHILLDFHAEATSEKVAMGHYLDGRVTAVIGTHTHVQTADDQGAAQGHGIHHRRRHDRSAKFGDRRQQADNPADVS